MSESATNTGALKRAIFDNKKAAGVPETNGINAFEKALNRNRKAANLKQKPAGFTLEQKNKKTEEN